MNPYILLLDLGLGFLKTLLASLTKSNAPAQVIDAVQAAFAAIEAHQNDEVTKANLESQRG